ncbi:MAG: nucleoside-diphosphate kinase [Candidatus Woykebacteria bacterium RBG_13_40_7b]|uniref:nucleoside-diphosphate kinase n=1 Tax=Candidatus Woykebacteria bacterium RBG_13_40_7b TaxID=1802594 RepID=A0A1G1W9V2_9BACT|nr:MAG: nucleoside-diphosphate kinase [Candidatus Woykebacteria bacterium RBG_13_40_7b]
MTERTIVLIKPDAVKRALVGEVIHRFERSGLKIIALKMLKATEEQVAKLYSLEENFLVGMGNKTLKTCEKYNLDPIRELGTDNPLEIGKMIRGWNIKYLSSGPIIAILLEGYHAVDNVRSLVGDTIPTFAQAGTIRGDFSLDSPAIANAEKRAVANIVHATGTKEETEKEGKIWFTEDEIYSYKRSDENLTG